MQGSVLSPILYAAFIDKLPKRLREHITPSQTLGNVKFATTFLYADDIAIVGKDKRQLQSMLETCEDFQNNCTSTPASAEWSHPTG